MNLSCPKCEGTLKVFEVKTHYGGKLFVDQCENCGGIWFDPSEYYQVHKDDIKKLEFSLKENTKNKTISEIGDATKGEMKCPRDKSILSPFKDPSIPSSVEIERCMVCGGVWFDKGELSGLKDEIRKKKEMFKKFEDNIDKILSLHSNEKKYKEITRLSKSLMQPYFDAEGNPNEKMSLVFRTVNLIVQLLFTL